MTQPKIKKYRCIVTLEQAKQVHANIANPAVKLMITPEVVKMILEANAEVIEGELHLIEIAEMLFCKIKNTRMEYNTLEQFNAEYEEIE